MCFDGSERKCCDDKCFYIYIFYILFTIIQERKCWQVFLQKSTWSSQTECSFRKSTSDLFCSFFDSCSSLWTMFVHITHKMGARLKQKGAYDNLTIVWQSLCCEDLPSDILLRVCCSAPCCLIQHTSYTMYTFCIHLINAKGVLPSLCLIHTVCNTPDICTSAHPIYTTAKIDNVACV